MTELVECNTQLHKTLQGLWSDALTQHKLQQQVHEVIPLYDGITQALDEHIHVEDGPLPPAICMATVRGVHNAW